MTFFYKNRSLEFNENTKYEDLNSVNEKLLWKYMGSSGDTKRLKHLDKLMNIFDRIDKDLAAIPIFHE